MHPLTAKDLLATWERGLSQTSVRRLISLLAGVYPGLSEEQLWLLPIGQRDGLALAARERLFGGRLASIAQCPACAQPLEFELDVADLRLSNLPPELPPDAAPHSCHWNNGGKHYELRFRLPDSLDLLLAEAQPHPEAALQLLLGRCLLAAKSGRSQLKVENLPSGALAALEEAMSQVDPQANTQLDLSCPACNHRWLAALDIGSFLWREFHAWALRLLGEVHVLAKHYCWAEADILAMSPTRRRLYLEQLS